MSNLPRLGSKAPNFYANTTIGPIKLSDYKGKWVVLFSHPSDFTPVCVTELLSFSKYYNEFKQRNADLIGLSVNNDNSHLTWLYNIYQLTGIEIPFPIIEDIDMNVAKLYGMIPDSTNNESTARCVFIIDDKQILRTMLYYPQSTGRNILEVLRIIEALQTSDRDNVLTPANWFPGMPFILPYPKTYIELENQIKDCKNEDSSFTDWYLCFVPDKNTMKIKNNKLEYMAQSQHKKNLKPKKVSRQDSLSIFAPTLTSPNCLGYEPIVMTYVLGDPQNVDPSLLDAVIYAFVEINANGTLSVPTPNYLRQLVNLKSYNPELKVIAAIGGWGMDGFSGAALTPTSRYKFARETNRIINEYGLDGIDIDWEYPGISAAGIEARPEDRENFTLLLTAIRDVIGTNKWLSVAGIGDVAYTTNSADITAIAPIIDYFNLMSYDFTAGEVGERGARHQANLYPSPLALAGFSVDGMVKNLISNGMPSKKILLGVPFYGRLGATVTRSFDQLRQNYLNQAGYETIFDPQAMASYLVKDGEFVMSYDDALSIYLKGQYVLQNCLGGIFAWMSTYDKANILAKYLYQSINEPLELQQEIKSYINQ